MYDELVNALRVCADGEHCIKCPKWELKLNAGRNACEFAICTEADDAIEELLCENEEITFRANQLEAMNDALMGETGAVDAVLVGAQMPLPRWIPVEERLPEPFDRVIVYDKRWGVLSAMKGEDDSWGGRNDIVIEKVTHWMPLPEPPKEK